MKFTVELSLFSHTDYSTRVPPQYSVHFRHLASDSDPPPLVNNKTPITREGKPAYLADLSPSKAKAFSRTPIIDLKKAEQTITIGPNLLFYHTEHLRLLIPKLSSRGCIELLANMAVPVLYVGHDLYYNEASFRAVLLRITRPGCAGLAIPGSAKSNHLKRSLPTPYTQVPLNVIQDATSPRAIAELHLLHTKDTQKITSLLDAISRYDNPPYRPVKETPK
jgi:hypothetical protein